MEINISGLKCDCCDYRDDLVQFSEFKDSIGRPCPKCGESLLTKEDYEKSLRLYKIVNVYNRLTNIFKWVNPIYYLNKILKRAYVELNSTVYLPNKIHNEKPTISIVVSNTTSESDSM